MSNQSCYVHRPDTTSQQILESATFTESRNWIAAGKWCHKSHNYAIITSTDNLSCQEFSGSRIVSSGVLRREGVCVCVCVCLTAAEAWNRNDKVTALDFICSYRAAERLWCKERGNIKALPVTALFNDIGWHTGRIRSDYGRVVLNCQHGFEIDFASHLQ